MLHASEPFFYFTSSKSSLNMYDVLSGTPLLSYFLFYEITIFFCTLWIFSALNKVGQSAASIIQQLLQCFYQDICLTTK